MVPNSACTRGCPLFFEALAITADSGPGAVGRFCSCFQVIVRRPSDMPAGITAEPCPPWTSRPVTRLPIQIVRFAGAFWPLPGPMYSDSETKKRPCPPAWLAAADAAWRRAKAAVSIAGLVAGRVARRPGARTAAAATPTAAAQVTAPTLIQNRRAARPPAAARLADDVARTELDRTSCIAQTSASLAAPVSALVGPR